MKQYWPKKNRWVNLTDTEKLKIRKRNLEIVSLLETGTYTLQEVGDKYGVSRQRIEQIAKKIIGVAGIFHYISHKEEKIKRFAEFMKKVKFTCIGCGKKVTYAEGKGLRSYCWDCRVQILVTGRARDGRVTFKCKECGKEFHPWRNYKWQKPIYCSTECYIKHGIGKA